MILSIVLEGFLTNKMLSILFYRVMKVANITEKIDNPC